MAVKARAQITLTVQIDIQSVWWYYKLQSSTAVKPARPTTNPPSGWTLTEPSYTEASTNTLYFVELTVFTDGSFQYSDVSVDSSYEAAKAAWNKANAAQSAANHANDKIDRLQVGGRNLVLQSKTFEQGDDLWDLNSQWTKSVDDEGYTAISQARTGATENNWARAIPHRHLSRAEIDDAPEGYTVSFDFMLDSKSDFLSNPQSLYGIIMALQNYDADGARVGWVEKWDIVTGNGLNKTLDDIVEGEWTRLAARVAQSDLTLVQPGYSAPVARSSLSFQLVRNGSIHIRKVKLEKGNKATDWTPAPEDYADALETELKLADVSAQINVASDSIRQEVKADYTAAADNIAALDRRLETLSTQSENNFSWTVTQIDALGSNLSSATEATEEQLRLIQTYMTFSQDGLTIGKTRNPFTFRVVNDRLAFFMNNTEVAYLSNNKLYVTHAEILTSMMIGKFAFVPQTNGNLSLIFTG